MMHHKQLTKMMYRVCSRKSGSCNPQPSLDVITTLEQLYDAVLNQSLYVSAVPYNVDDAAVLLVSICCML